MHKPYLCEKLKSIIPKSKYKSAITAEAHRLGFEFISFAKAEKMEPETRRLEAWLNANHHGKMAYMANHFEKRTDPTKLVEGAKTVVSLMYNYHTEKNKPIPKYLKFPNTPTGRIITLFSKPNSGNYLNLSTKRSEKSMAGYLWILRQFWNATGPAVAASGGWEKIPC